MSCLRLAKENRFKVMLPSVSYLVFSDLRTHQVAIIIETHCKYDSFITDGEEERDAEEEVLGRCFSGFTHMQCEVKQTLWLYYHV